MQQLEKSSIVLVSLTISREGALEQYLPKYVNNFAIVTIAPPYSKNATSQGRLYEQGKIVKKFNLRSINIPESLLGLRLFLVPLVNIFRALSTIYSMLKLKTHFHIYIGVGYMYTIVGLVLRRIKLVDKVIYYNGDYFPLPTKIGIYTLFNRIFQIIDNLCTNKSDIVWNASPGLIEIKMQKQIITSKSPPQIIVPVGINSSEISQKPLNMIDTASIGFMGVIGELSGLDLLINALPEVKKKIPNIKLNVIGSGPCEKRARDIAHKNGLENHVIFWGFVADTGRVKEILSNCVIGIAPYIPSISSFTQFTEPGKVMEYLSLGLPVIVTKVPRIAFEINSRRAGFAIEYNKEQLVDAILKLLTNNNLLKEYRENALQLAIGV